MERTLYEVLGLTETATPDQIKKAYRKLAQKHHPDKDGGDGDGTEFKLVKEAYEVLSDPERRARYDRDGTYRHDGRQTEEERINAFAMNALASLLHRLIEGTEWVEHTDILELIRSEVRKMTENDKADLAGYQKSKAKHERAMGRIKAKEGDNLAAFAIQRVINEIDSKIKNEEENIKIGEHLMGILDNHEYEVTEADDATREAMMSAERKAQSEMLARFLSTGFRSPGGAL